MQGFHQGAGEVECLARGGEKLAGRAGQYLAGLILELAFPEYGKVTGAPRDREERIRASSFLARGSRHG